jgi:hypothetical protein
MVQGNHSEVFCTWRGGRNIEDFHDWSKEVISTTNKINDGIVAPLAMPHNLSGDQKGYQQPGTSMCHASPEKEE